MSKGRYLIFLDHLRPNKELFSGVSVSQPGGHPRVPFNPESYYAVVMGDNGAVLLTRTVLIGMVEGKSRVVRPQRMKNRANPSPPEAPHVVELLNPARFRGRQAVSSSCQRGNTRGPGLVPGPASSTCLFLALCPRGGDLRVNGFRNEVRRAIDTGVRCHGSVSPDHSFAIARQSTARSFASVQTSQKSGSAACGR